MKKKTIEMAKGQINLKVNSKFKSNNFFDSFLFFAFRPFSTHSYIRSHI